MKNLLETIKSAQSFSEIYPELKTWKKAIQNHWDFIDWNAMTGFASLYLPNYEDASDFDSKTFIQACELIHQWREEVNNTFKIDFKNYKQSFQIDFAFGDAPPLQHIVEAENRMFVVCILASLKGLNEQKLYQEFEHYKKAHERHWKITQLKNTYKWAMLENDQIALSDELVIPKVGALSFL